MCNRQYFYSTLSISAADSREPDWMLKLQNCQSISQTTTQRCVRYYSGGRRFAYFSLLQTSPLAARLETWKPPRHNCVGRATALYCSVAQAEVHNQPTDGPAVFYAQKLPSEAHRAFPSNKSDSSRAAGRVVACFHARWSSPVRAPWEWWLTSRLGSGSPAAGRAL